MEKDSCELRGFSEKKGEFSLSGNFLKALFEATANENISFRFKVRGFSMWPFIKDNDVVVVSPLATLYLKLGMAVAFIHPVNQKLVIHRIVRKDKGGYIIKGDNILGIDGLIQRENILGVVSGIQRQGREVRLGFGWQRVFVAFFSRFGLLPFIRLCWRMTLLRPLIDSVRKLWWATEGFIRRSPS